VGARDHLQGPADAPAILLEYGDYECPICGAAYVLVKEIQQAMGDRLGFVFRNFPLAEMHPHAMDAAQAAEAAGAQGKFWEMHDMLFENQDDLERDHLAAYAKALGLDAVRLIDELAAGTYAKHVREDFRSGVRSGVNGTPTFFINGIRYDGSRDVESMIAALTAENG
jgi:protein-disulfide isomerase